ncbi:transglycosylase domain-containing protein [Bernardetia sp.]|uniref:transglycosylase domain-containing protein n=1 Tax=Bernardetia sp. TaxID=1937974 RepID=UPI0025BBDA16|nr:transglycosylase domain-containing protein [Bernardetia sp.]
MKNYLPFFKTIAQKIWSVFGFPKGESKLIRFCRVLWWLTITGLSSIILLFVAIIFNWFGFFGEIPSLKALENPKTPMPSVVYTSDSVEVVRYYSRNKTPLKYEQIDSMTILALLATEDARFERHSGIDAKATFSIFWYLLKGNNRGGSTLSQQLAKNMFDTRSKENTGKLAGKGKISTIIAKAKEWVMAVRLERSYTKKEILNMYLNEVAFGNNAIGLHAAARKYFSTSPDSLEVHQSALLVGLLKAPSTYNPLRNPEKAIKRRNTVLNQMEKYKYISSKEASSLKELPLDLDISYEVAETGTSTYYKNFVTQKLKKWCEQNGYDLYADGLEIYLTIDSKIQAHAEAAIARQMPILQDKFYEQWKGLVPWTNSDKEPIENYIENAVAKTDYYKFLVEKYGKQSDSVQILLEKPKKMTVFTWATENHRTDTTLSTIDSVKYYKQILRSGLVSLDPYTGHIKAWVGGIDFEYFKYDQVRQAKRQPGSTFKMFVYAAAIDSLNMSPCDTILDTNPIIRYEENGEQKVWTPHNADWTNTYRYMTLRHAMGRSINTVTAKLTEKVGWTTVAHYAKKMGIESKLAEVPSIGLGSSDVSLFEMVGAYSTIMNAGMWQEPQILWHVKDKHGKILNYFYNDSHRALSKESAWLMSYMLKGGTQEPYGTSLALWSYGVLGNGNDIGGKTGTSSNFADGWYMGVTKDLVTGVWVGGDDKAIRFRTSSVGEGSKTALPIFGVYLKSLYEDKNTGIRRGKFLPPTVEVQRSYYCPTPKYDRYPEKDSTDVEEVIE